jgi:predicted protein tyrosine phosphatase
MCFGYHFACCGYWPPSITNICICNDVALPTNDGTFDNCKACKTTTSINPSLNLVNNKEKIKFTFLLFYWEKSKEKMTQKYDLNLKQKRRWNNILDDVVCWGCDDGLKDLY